jgi:purine nucleosidase
MRRVLLDTDLAMGAPGSDIDDGFALAMALADPEMTVEMVTTVSGNTDVDTATRLTLGLLERLGRGDVPVVRGASRGLRGWWRGAPGQPLARPEGAAGAEPGYAAVHLIERVMAEPGELTIVAIGPLTNLALALAMEPGVAQRVREIVVMGGVFLKQTNLAAMPGEFNTWADPDATAIVLASGAPLRFVGLDVTEQVRLTRGHASTMVGSGSAFGSFAGECALEWINHKQRTNPGDPRSQDSCAMHDPLAVAVVTRPDLVTWQPAFVQVETSSAVTRGVMVADLLTLDDPPKPNCQIAVAVDSQRFVDLFLERVSAL